MAHTHLARPKVVVVYKSEGGRKCGRRLGSGSKPTGSFRVAVGEKQTFVHAKWNDG
jgi:hypothetical protein